MSVTYGAIYGGCYTAGYGADNELTLTYARPQAAFTSSVATTTGRTVTFTNTTSDPHSYVASWLWDFGDNTTSTDQSPAAHVYPLEGTQYTATLSTVDIFGRRSTVSHTIQTVVPVDNGYYLPTMASGFAYKGVTTPASLWLCQELSGNLADSIGSLTLVAANTPLYDQTAGLFTRKGVGFTEGSTGRFTAAAGSGPNPTTTATVWLVLCQFAADQTGVREIVSAGTAERARITAGELIRAVSGANTADGAATMRSVPQFIGLDYDRTNSVTRVRTETETMTPTFTTASADGEKGFGAASTSAFGGQIVWACMWSGSAASNLDIVATIAALKV